MQRHPFTIRQMFHLKPKTLEKRLTLYYRASGDSATVVKLVRLLQIRAYLGTEELKEPCRELIRALYINQKAEHREILTRYFYYFRGYFSQTEWEILLDCFVQRTPVFHAWQVLRLLAQVCEVVAHSFTVP